MWLGLKSLKIPWLSPGYQVELCSFGHVSLVSIRLHAVCSDSCSKYNFGEVHFVVNSLFLSDLERQKVFFKLSGSRFIVTAHWMISLTLKKESDWYRGVRHVIVQWFLT